jgi:quercetin dioxygenase-like cupin family protein
MSTTKGGAAQAKHLVWAEVVPDRPLPRIERRRLMGDRMMVSHVTLERGFKVDLHRHENEQISCVLSGAFRFWIGDAGSPDRRETIVKAGEAILFPGNVAHGGEALEQTVILDMFSPPSEATGVDKR